MYIYLNPIPNPNIYIGKVRENCGKEALEALNHRIYKYINIYK
jgi:hypothetical protein